MTEMSESNRWEKELAQFQEVLANPTGQAIVIVGPEGSGKSTLLTEMVLRSEKDEKLHTDCKIYRVGPRDRPNDVIGEIGRGTGGPLTYLIARDILERLSSAVEEFGDIHRRVIGVDAKPTQPATFMKWWLDIIPNLPEKVKFIFTQRPDGILATNKQFMALPNVVRIDIEVPPAPDDGSEGKFKDKGQLITAFVKFLEEKKGYHNSTMIMQERDVGIYGRGIDKDIRQYLAIFDHEKQTHLAIVEFGLKEDEEIFNRAGLLLENSIKNTGSEDIEGYVVFPSEADSDEDFSIYWLDKFNKAKEQIYYDDFPNYEILRGSVEKNEDELQVADFLRGLRVNFRTF